MLILIFFIIIVIIAVILKNNTPKYVDGGGYKPSKLVIDTLNISHMLYGKVDIENTIKHVCEKYKGRIMFVVKDRNSGGCGENLQKLSEKYKCYIYYTKIFAKLNNREHSGNSRDDFYCVYLANKFDCPILSNDKMRDFREFAKNVEKFEIIEYSPFKKPIKNIYNPVVHKNYGNKIRKPKIISLIN